MSTFWHCLLSNSHCKCKLKLQRYESTSSWEQITQIMQHILIFLFYMQKVTDCHVFLIKVNWPQSFEGNGDLSQQWCSSAGHFASHLFPSSAFLCCDSLNHHIWCLPCNVWEEHIHMHVEEWKWWHILLNKNPEGKILLIKMLLSVYYFDFVFCFLHSWII